VLQVLLLNNQHLGMVVQWEDRFYKVSFYKDSIGRSTAGPRGWGAAVTKWWKRGAGIHASWKRFCMSMGIIRYDTPPLMQKRFQLAW